jgi:hypothetical protein
LSEIESWRDMSGLKEDFLNVVKDATTSAVARVTPRATIAQTLVRLHLRDKDSIIRYQKIDPYPSSYTRRNPDIGPWGSDQDLAGDLGFNLPPMKPLDISEFAILPGERSSIARLSIESRSSTRLSIVSSEHDINKARQDPVAVGVRNPSRPWDKQRKSSYITVKSLDDNEHAPEGTGVRSARNSGYNAQLTQTSPYGFEASKASKDELSPDKLGILPSSNDSPRTPGSPRINQIASIGDQPDMSRKQDDAGRDVSVFKDIPLSPAIQPPTDHSAPKTALSLSQWGHRSDTLVNLLASRFKPVNDGVIQSLRRDGLAWSQIGLKFPETNLSSLQVRFWTGLLWDSVPWDLLHQELLREIYTVPNEARFDSISRHIVDLLNQQLPSEESRYRMHFDVNLSLMEFMASQYENPAVTSLNSVITLTGSSLNAKAATCGDYMSQTWPTTGKLFISALETALGIGNSSISLAGKRCRFYFTFSKAI